jgi:hypothetical protein
MNWQPIETAPKDCEFLAYGWYVYPGDTARTEYWCVAEYDPAIPGYPWVDHEGAHPDLFFSHWAPLTRPELPDVMPGVGFQFPEPPA